jgi:hypothetical protein
MKISVEVENAYSFPVIDLVTGIILIAAAVFFLTYFIYRIRNKDKFDAPPKAREYTPSQREKIRNKYLNSLYKIQVNYSNGKLTERELNEKLSRMCRGYVQEISGRETSKMTLSELRRASGLIGLSKAIALFYQPEFAPVSRSSAQYNIGAAREVISKWI